MKVGKKPKFKIGVETETIYVKIPSAKRSKVLEAIYKVIKDDLYKKQ